MRIHRIGLRFLVASFLGLATCARAQNVLVSGSSSQESSSASEEVIVLEESQTVTTSEQVELVSFSGTVEVKRSGSSDYEAVTEGMFLVSGDTIKTGAGASAVLGFDEEDKNIVRVEENTTSVILLKDNEKVELLQGEVFSIIQSLPAGSSFEVRTPTAVAGARGTEWATRYDGDETEVEAYDDAPFVKSISESGALGQEMKVVTGYATRVPRFQPPTRMREIPQARREMWQNRRQVMRQDIQGIRERRGRPDRAQFRAQQEKLQKKARTNRARQDAEGIKKKSEDPRIQKAAEKIRAAVEKKADQGRGNVFVGDNKVKDAKQAAEVRAQEAGAGIQAKVQQPVSMQPVERKQAAQQGVKATTARAVSAAVRRR